MSSYASKAEEIRIRQLTLFDRARQVIEIIAGDHSNLVVTPEDIEELLELKLGEFSFPQEPWNIEIVEWDTPWEDEDIPLNVVKVGCNRVPWYIYTAWSVDNKVVFYISDVPPDDEANASPEDDVEELQIQE